MHMACSMKRKAFSFISAAVMLLGAFSSCSQKYEMDLPFALNRVEMKFASSGNSYYVLVYSDGAWTASLDKEVSWVSLSRTSGHGNSQIMVTADLNTGTSRGVNLIVKHGTQTREMYISQEAGNAEAGNYNLVKTRVDVLKKAATCRVMAGTDLDEQTLADVQTTVQYATEAEDWVHDIAVTANRVSFRVDENTTGEARSATVELSFPRARWDTPVTAFFQINQSVSEPSEVSATVNPIAGKNLLWDEEDHIALLDADGVTVIAAEMNSDPASTASFLFNADAVKEGIFAAVYPEALVTNWGGGKVYIALPAEQDYMPSISKVADLAVLAGKKEGTDIVFQSACSLLKIKVSGSGTLKELSLTAGIPIAGNGTVDMSAATPVYEPLAADGLSEIKVVLPGEGVSLPVETYVAVPSINLGRLRVSATSDHWSGSITCESESVGVVNDIVPLEAISLELPSETVDLSAGGAWANCYLVEDEQPKMYSIDIRRRDGSVPAGKITRSSILWQTDPFVLNYLAIDAAEGKLYFRKETAGNAHIAVLDDQGLIRWSWHIWAPAEPVETRKIGDYTFMDRNLGALKAAVSDYSNASIGMHYQWGRKDPFPPAKATAASGNGFRSTVYPDNISFVTAQDGVSQEIADANPTTYYWGSGASGKQDWRDVQDDALWATASSNSNPCPSGWTVASNDALSLIPERLKQAEYVSRVGITIQDDEGKSMLFVPGGAYRRSVSSASELANMSDGWIWSSTPMEMGTYRGSYRLWYQSNTNNRRIDTTYPQRRWGGNVRCVKTK